MEEESQGRIRELAPERFLRGVRRSEPLAGPGQDRFPKEKIKMSTTQVPVIDMNKLNAFIGQFVTDLGAAVHTGMVVIGEKLGLYKALAEGPMTVSQLAARTRTDQRYVREWLASQAA